MLDAIVRQPGAAILALAALLALDGEKVPKLPKPFTNAPVDSWLLEENLESDPRYRRRFFEAHAAEMAKGKLVDVLSALVRDFREHPWSEHAAEHARVQSQLDHFLDAFRAAYAGATSDGLLDTAEEESKLFESLNTAGFGREVFLPSPTGPELAPVDTYFVREGEPAAALAPYRNLSTDEREEYELLLARHEMVDFRLRADAITDFLDKKIGLAREQNVASLRNAVERWENYLDNGYSQYPWESLFNGAVLDIPELGPPDRQWILLHPTLGVEVSTHALDDVQAKESLDLELIGYLKYKGEMYDDFWGGSLTVSLRDDLSPGLGVLAHFSRSFNLGVSWHDVDRDGRYFDEAPYLFFSLDLFRFVQAQKSDLRERYDNARRLLGATEGN